MTDASSQSGIPNAVRKHGAAKVLDALDDFMVDAILSGEPDYGPDCLNNGGRMRNGKRCNRAEGCAYPTCRDARDSNDERAAIVAWLRRENELCDCAARSEGECACGAWYGSKDTNLPRLADAIERGEDRGTGPIEADDRCCPDCGNTEDNCECSADLECEPMHPGPDGWSEWVHPLPGYLMQCCDCGLVHEMEFAIGRVNEPGAYNDGEDDDHRVLFRASRHASVGEHAKRENSRSEVEARRAADAVPAAEQADAPTPSSESPHA